VTFRPTDPSFAARPGDTPRVVVDREQLPHRPLHSVGIIEVSAGTAARAGELAAAKGRDLGCWVIVEHSVFVEASSALAFGARTMLAHGSAPHASEARPRRTVVRFDCVLIGVPAPRT
jgi:hypothetical protein